MSVKEYTEQQLDELFTHFGGFDINERNEIMYLMDGIEFVVMLYDKQTSLPNGIGVKAQMEYRMPKKPIVTLTQKYFLPNMKVVKCPTCKRKLKPKRGSNNDAYCPSCGQAIDWTNVEI